MLTRTKIALAAALIVGSASVAMADGEFDPNLGNRYPGYNGPAVTTFQSAPVSLERRGQLRSAPVRLQNQNTFRGTFQEPISHGAGHAPGAFYQQEQPGYPQSPPGGGY